MAPSEDFLRMVEAAFARLIERRDLRVAASVYHEEAFGNAYVELAGPGFYIRPSLDRRWGEVIRTDVASAEHRLETNSLGVEDRWVELDVLLGLLKIEVETSPIATPHQAAILVETHFSKIQAAFSEANYDRTWANVEEFRHKAWLRFKERFGQPGKGH